MKKIGIVSTIAKTGGIKLKNEDVWLNPTKEARVHVTQELRGKEVELTIINPEKNIFNEISWSNLPKMVIHPLPPLKEIKKPNNDLLIVRQVCLKVAGEVVAAEIKNNYCIDDLPREITDLAEKLEKWTWRTPE